MKHERVMTTEQAKTAGWSIKRNEKRPIDPIRLYRNEPPTLGDVMPGFVRLRVSRKVKETQKAYLLMIQGTLHWLPRKHVKLGLHPDRTSHAVDIEGWLYNRKFKDN